MNITGIFDQIIVAFFKSLSVVDYLVGFLLLILILWLISSLFRDLDEVANLLKEIRDSLKK